jgi:hypothetical protein
MEVGNEYPTTRVIGIDISPIQPNKVPSNVEFIMMDLTEGLQFNDGSTDLVQSRFILHSGPMSLNGRLINAGVTVDKWPGFMREAFRILKPGSGWAQCIEFAFPFVFSENNSLPLDAPLSKVNQAYIVPHGGPKLII